MSSVPKPKQLRIRSLVEDPGLVEANRGRLIESATKLFRSNGFHNTSTRDIARDAGVSVGAIYQYIRHKEDLLVLILQSMVTLHESKLYPLFDDVERGAERLWDAIDVYYRTLDAHHESTHVLYHEFPTLNRSLRVHFRETQDRIFLGFVGILQQGMDEGDFTRFNAHFLAQNIAAMGHMWALRRGRFRDQMTIDEYIQAQFESLRALIARPGN